MDKEEPGWAYGRVTAPMQPLPWNDIAKAADRLGGRLVVNAFVFGDADGCAVFNDWYAKNAPVGLRVRSRVAREVPRVWLEGANGPVILVSSDELSLTEAARQLEKQLKSRTVIMNDQLKQGIEALSRSGAARMLQPVSTPTGPEDSAWEGYVKQLAGMPEAERAHRLYGTFEPTSVPFELDPRECVANTFNHRPVSAWSTSMPTGVRITHQPTGIMVEETTGRSTHVNKAEAFRKLTALVAAAPKPVKAPTPPPFGTLEGLRAWHQDQADLQKAEDAKFTAMCHARTEPGKVTTFARIAEQARALAELHLSAVHVLNEAAKG